MVWALLPAAALCLAIALAVPYERRERRRHRRRRTQLLIDQQRALLTALASVRLSVDPITILRTDDGRGDLVTFLATTRISYSIKRPEAFRIRGTDA